MIFLLTHKDIRGLIPANTKKDNLAVILSCGEGGIRTPGTSQYVGFQDRCNRPLCHLS